MRRSSAASSSGLTWGLAITFVALINVLLVRSPLIWAKTTLWMRGQAAGTAFWQTYDVARTLYRPRPAAAVRVAILGNSRIWIPAQASFVEAEIKRVAPALDVRVDNLAFFGAHIGDVEIVSRHLDRLEPTLVIVGLGGSELLPTEWGQLVNPTGRFLDIGWSDGPVPPDGLAGRVDRWARTVWPLYRFRTFARYAIEDRLLPDPLSVRFPDHFASSAEVFGFLDPDKALEIEAAYQAWRRDGALSSFVSYLTVKSNMVGVVEPLPDPSALTADSLGMKTLDRLLSRLAGSSWKSFVLLMPENPLLDLDTQGVYHRPGFSDRAAQLIAQAAGRYHIQVVDGRRWMPPEAFADFLHLMPDISGFQTPLVQEILHELES